MHKQPVPAILTTEERRAYRTLANAARRVQELAAKRKAENDAPPARGRTVGGRVMAHLSLDADELRPIIAAAVFETLAQLRADDERLSDRLAFDEREAARLIGLESHQLRDERLRGRIAASQIVGRRIRYRREDLLAYLSAHRTEARQ